MACWLPPLFSLVTFSVYLFRKPVLQAATDAKLTRIIVQLNKFAESYFLKNHVTPRLHWPIFI